MGKAKSIHNAEMPKQVLQLASFCGFAALKAMTARNDDPQRPADLFDKDRDGFCNGRRRSCFNIRRVWHARASGAKIYTEIVGLGASKNLCNWALEEAGVKPEELDYLNLHELLLQLPTKSMTGHLLGAAGAIEAIKISIKAINDNIVPPTINMTEPDPEIPEEIQIVFNRIITQRSENSDE
ncbi:hypothetical protein FQR65_LT15334 [Abscondita terminalis]|nr:hypothetical protein FQR65_LT15334 [Abscondita terminalis]